MQLQADIEQAWKCKLHHLPHLFSVDFYAERDDNLVAWLEVKQRSCSSTKYATVFMNIGRKFRHLEALSLTAPAMFVVRWSDGVTKYINVKDVAPDWQSIGGENNRWGAGQHDYEPVYEIPISVMKPLS
jgi:hypothetical protein